MADICIVHASEDKAIAELLYEHLSHLWDVWWDDKLTDEWHKVVQVEIPKASCVVPLYSNCSRDKGTVIGELLLGKKHNKSLLPVKIDNSDPPVGFEAYSSVDMRGWTGSDEHPGFKQLLRRISSVVPPRNNHRRPISIANSVVRLPSIFLSVSSFYTQLMPSEAVKALRVFGAPTILVSAYDLDEKQNPKTLISELKKYKKNGGFVLLDSGNYEASRLSDNKWKSTRLKRVLENVPHDWVFCFDKLEPSKGYRVNVNDVIQSVEYAQSCTASPVLPIVHAPRNTNGAYMLHDIPRIIRMISEALEPSLIAIPERELGSGVIERAKTIKLIRQELNKLHFYQPLHILGTGNPWTIPIFIAAGADTFDGLEWCRSVVDRASNKLHHFQHFDFFGYQAGLADSPIALEAFQDPDIDYVGKVAFHNVDYYIGFEKEIRDRVSNGNIEAYIEGLLGFESAKQLKQQIPDLYV